MPTGPDGGPPPVNDVCCRRFKVTMARNLIQMRLSQTAEFVEIASQELNREFDLNRHEDQSALLSRFADRQFGWAGAFRLWEEEMAETPENRYYYSEQLDREVGHGWIFRPQFEADHQALLMFFEVEALVIPFEQGALNLKVIFDQVKSWRDKTYCPPEPTTPEC